MSFLHIEFLYLMLPPVLILFYFILTQKEPTAELFDARVYPRLLAKEKRLTLRQRNAIYLLIFILLIIAMAQPVIIEKTMRVKVPVREFTAAIDISASMQSDDLYPSRLGVARMKLLQLIDGAKRERIGILAFGKDVYVVSPPSSDMQALRQVMAGFTPDAYAEKGTDLMALLVAANSVMGTRSDKRLLLLTDGGDQRDFSDAIAFAKQNHMHIFILGTATPQGAPLTLNGVAITQGGAAVRTALNPALHTLAEATGGVYLDAAPGASDVKKMQQSLLRGLEGGENGVKEVKVYGQLFILPLALALFLLLLANASMSRRERLIVPPALLFGMLFFGEGGVPLQAEPFDYEVLRDAKTYYKEQAYPRAARAYYRYAKQNDDDPEALYDSAHALYRAGKYEAAAMMWAGIHTNRRLLQYRSLHNLGNAYAMLGDEEHLQAAIKAYRQALHLQNDAETKENMAIVLGRLIRLMQAKRKLQANAPLPQPSQAADKPKADASEHPSEPPASGKEKQKEGNMQPSESTASSEKTAMSDYEAAMWMQSLQRGTPPHLYKITPPGSEGGSHVSPW